MFKKEGVMSEHEIRNKLRKICGDLDRLAGRVGPAGRASAVLAPLMLGAGIALIACDSEVETTGGEGGTATTTTTTYTGSSTLYGVGGAGGYAPPPYGVGGWGGSTSDYGVAGAAPPYGVGGYGAGDSGGGGGAGGA